MIKENQSETNLILFDQQIKIRDDYLLLLFWIFIVFPILSSTFKILQPIEVLRNLNFFL
jgi:hypothetical protein